MKIRAYEEADRALIIALWHECGLVSPQNDPDKDIDRKLKVDADLFLVGIETDEVGSDIVIASVMGGYEGHRGWINYLAVSPNHQRKGYGQAIMKAVESRIQAKGCPKINLQVRNTNQAVIEFYAALGYGDDNVVGLGKRLGKV
jgi:ribosomal protein S18 acetylase RimI-like enzyme